MEATVQSPVIDIWWFIQILFGVIFMGLFIWQLTTIVVTQKAAKAARITPSFLWMTIGVLNMILLLGSFIWLLLIK